MLITRRPRLMVFISCLITSIDFCQKTIGNKRSHTDPQPHLHHIRDLKQVVEVQNFMPSVCCLLEFERGRQSIGNGGCWVKPQWVVGIDFGAVEDLDCRAFLASACRGSCNRRISIRCYQLPPISLPPPEWPSTSS